METRAALQAILFRNDSVDKMDTTEHDQRLREPLSLLTTLSSPKKHVRMQALKTLQGESLYSEQLVSRDELCLIAVQLSFHVGNLRDDPEAALAQVNALR